MCLENLFTRGTKLHYKMLVIRMMKYFINVSMLSYIKLFDCPYYFVFGIILLTLAFSSNVLHNILPNSAF